jgi:hypothetical protein
MVLTSCEDSTVGGEDTFFCLSGLERESRLRGAKIRCPLILINAEYFSHGLKIIKINKINGKIYKENLKRTVLKKRGLNGGKFRQYSEIMHAVA